MKKIYTLAFVFLAFSAAINAQSYTFNPASKSVTGTVATDDYLDLEIDINNETSNPLTFEYQLISNTFNSGWYVTHCDYQTCYPYVPTNLETMDPLPGGSHAFVKLTINPGTIIASGEVSFEIWEQSTPGIKDTLTYTASSFVGVEKDLNDIVSVYPNPSSGNVFLASRNGELAQGTIKVLNLNGQVVFEGEVNGGYRVSIPLDGQADGLYLIRYTTEKGTASGKVLLNN